MIYKKIIIALLVSVAIVVMVTTLFFLKNKVVTENIVENVNGTPVLSDYMTFFGISQPILGEANADFKCDSDLMSYTEKGKNLSWGVVCEDIKHIPYVGLAWKKSDFKKVDFQKQIFDSFLKNRSEGQEFQLKGKFSCIERTDIVDLTQMRSVRGDCVTTITNAVKDEDKIPFYTSFIYSYPIESRVIGVNTVLIISSIDEATVKKVSDAIWDGLQRKNNKTVLDFPPLINEAIAGGGGGGGGGGGDASCSVGDASCGDGSAGDGGGSGGDGGGLGDVGIVGSTVFAAPNPACPLPWGGSIPYGSSVTAYNTASVVYPATCASQARTCGLGGVLSGSYTSPSCSVRMPPVANAGIDQLITQPTSASAPAGAMAYDAEGPVTILWTSTVRPTGAGPVEIRRETTLTPTFASLSTIGTYVFTLTVTDTDGLVSTDSMNVVVQAEGTPTGTPGPTGDIWADGTSGSIAIPTGGSATITWDSDDTTDCRILEGSSQIATGVSNSTGVSVSPAAPTLYSLICDGTNGALNVLIDVVSINPANNLPPTISVNRRVVPEGDGVNLTWNLNGGTGPCVLTANNISVLGYLNITTSGGYVVPSVNVTTIYEIQCPSGSDSVRVEIIPRGFET